MKASSIFKRISYVPHIRMNLYIATICQLLVMMAAYTLLRLCFYWLNSDLTGNVSGSRLLHICLYGMRFDLSALLWLNIPFILMRFLPVPFAMNRRWLKAGNIVFGIVNSFGLLATITDLALFRYTGARMRFDALAGWLGEGNIAGIVVSYFAECWWVFLLAIIFVWATLWCALRFKPVGKPFPIKGKWARYGLQTAALGVAATVCIFGMRGVFKGHPLKISDAINAVDNMSQVPIVQNTPFCIIRTIGKGTDQLEPVRFYSDQELARIRSSVHHPDTTATAIAKGKNIFVIIMESGGAYWSDRLNVYPHGRQESLMPFLDSLAAKSLTVKNIFASGKGTIDGITTIFGGFPAVSPFMYMTSPYSSNRFDSPARLLSESGYSTKFYLGSEPGSCNLDQFLQISGFKEVTSRNSLPNDDDYDGAWGIFDHAMGAFAARDLSKLHQPFFAGWLTLNPHMPFKVPSGWKPDGYKSAAGTASQAAEYVDRSLRNFFEEARKQPWYDNTVFIITSDHGTRDFPKTPHDTDWIQPHIFFIVYAPDGSIPLGTVDDRVMSQHDIAPTLLGMAGYSKPFVALGSDVFSDSHAPYALNIINGSVQVMSTRYLAKFTPDMKKLEAFYDIRKDPTLKKSLTGQGKSLTGFEEKEAEAMTKWGRAFMQDYTTRTIEHRMSVTPGTVNHSLR